MNQGRTTKPLSVLVFLVCFSIPLNDQLSTGMLAALTLFLTGTFLLSAEGASRFWHQFKKYWPLLLIPASLLFIRVLALLYPGIGGSETEYAIRAIPLLWVPLLFIGISALRDGIEAESLVFKGLFYGCLTAMLLCEAHLFYEWIGNREPLEYLFRWRHLNIQFTEVIGIHPPYLGYLTLVVLFWLYIRKPKYYLPGLVLLSLFLMQLLARNAIVFLSLALILLVVQGKKYKLGLGMAALGILILSIAWFHPSRYLKNKINTILVFNKPNNRFARLDASYQTFLEKPWFGGGKQFAEQRRIYYYGIQQDERAVEQKLNAHNQYMEYLSTYGVFGFLIFLAGVAFAVYLVLKGPDRGFYLLVLTAFLFANLTESMLERSLGIKIFGLILALLVYRRTLHPIPDTMKANSDIP